MSNVTESARRVREYLHQQGTMRGLDHESLATANLAELRRSDLEVLLDHAEREVWTLTIDADDGVSTTVHGSAPEAYAELRGFLVEHDGEDVVPESPDELTEYATNEGGIAFYLDGPTS